MKPGIELNVNGKIHQVEADPETPLLYVLRNQLGDNALIARGDGEIGLNEKVVQKS